MGLDCYGLLNWNVVLAAKLGSALSVQEGLSVEDISISKPICWDENGGKI